MFKKIVLFILTIFVLAVFLGCAARAPFQLSSDLTKLDLTPDDYRVIGPAKGKDCVPVVFGIRTSNPSLKESEQRALDSANAKFLLNKKAFFGYEESYLMLFRQDCVYVEGIGVNFK